MRRAALVALLVASAGALLLGRFLASYSRGPGAPAEQFASQSPRGGPLPKLWQAPAFSYEDQHGQETTLAALGGQPWIADFIFTQCTTACPMMTSRMVLLQRALAGVALRFVSFSVDPAHDTPAALASYAHEWNPSETRWTLLSTRKDRLPETVAGFRVTAEPSGDPANPIIHSNVFLLVDGDGWVRGVYDSSDSVARDCLEADARHLAASPTVAAQPSGAIPAGGFYASVGCAGCHANPRIAPSLDNLRGQTVALQDGTRVIADDAYLRRSILDPGAQIVAGYSPLMPSYAKALSEAQVTVLVQEIRAMRSAQPIVTSAPAALVADPVCGMKVRAAAETVHIAYQGHDVYFCSETCRDAFLAHPAAYTHSQHAASP